MSETADSRRRGIVSMIFATAVLVFAGIGFVYKMTEFAATIVKQDIEGFGAVAIGVYLTGVVPLVFLTLWAIMSGRFRDIERPKYRMLEIHDELEDELEGELEGSARLASSTRIGR